MADFSFWLGWCLRRLADVKLTELDDRIRVEIDGKLFTEYRHKEWLAPYLYPVVGPNGETVTRHYPMKTDVPNEQQDHPHHRSIRFSHRMVNGFSFWSPQSPPKGTKSEIAFEKVEKMESGETGELILWNKWIGNGEVVLRERKRLTFIPMENNEVMMDYDVELHAGEKDVLFGDQKDGGLGVRVAGTMVVENRKTKTGKGTILNSRGAEERGGLGRTRGMGGLLRTGCERQDGGDRDLRSSFEFAVSDVVARADVWVDYGEPVWDGFVRPRKGREAWRWGLHDSS